jgi:hypothetical protein
MDLRYDPGCQCAERNADDNERRKRIPKETLSGLEQTGQQGMAFDIGDVRVFIW